MPDETYRFIYETSAAGAAKGIDQLLALLIKLEAKSDQVDAKLKALGGSLPGVAKSIADLQKLDAELKSKVTDAGAATKALQQVGTGNRAISGLNAKLEATGANLKGATAAAAGTAPALANVGQGAGGKGSGGGSGAGGIGLGVGGVMVAGRILGATADASTNQREYLAGVGGRVGEFRDSLREYASLRGRPGPDDDIVREASRFGMAAGMKPDEIRPFLTNYEGSAATGRMAGNIGGKVGENGYTPEQQRALEAQLKVVGGQFAVRTGLDAKTAGDLTGVVSTYKRLDSAADMAGQLGGMHYGLDQGRGEITPLARGELGQAGSAIASGRVSGLPELGAMIGVASVVSKTAGSAGTTYGQASRFLNETGAGDEDKAAFIEASGMGAAKGDFNKLKALRDYIAKVKPADVNSYLEAQGYGNSTDRRSVIGMMGSVDVLEERIAKAKSIAENGQDVLDRNAQNRASVGTADRRGEAKDFNSEVDQGLQMSRLAAARKYALGQLKDPNQPGGPRINTWGTYITDMLRTVATGGSVSGESERIDDRAMINLIRGGAKVGIDVRKKFPELNPGQLTPQNVAARARDFSAAYDMVTAAGGDPFGGAPIGGSGGGSGPGAEAARKLREAATAVERLDRPQGAPAGSANLAPEPGPSGNAGAGVVPGRR